MEWETTGKRGRRKTVQHKVKVAKVRIKPEAILMNHKDLATTFTDILMLMKTKVDKEVSAKINKIREMKSREVLVELQKASKLKKSKTT